MPYPNNPIGYLFHILLERDWPREAAVSLKSTVEKKGMGRKYGESPKKPFHYCLLRGSIILSRLLISWPRGSGKQASKLINVKITMP